MVKEPTPCPTQIRLALAMNGWIETPTGEWANGLAILPTWEAAIVALQDTEEPTHESSTYNPVG